MIKYEEHYSALSTLENATETPDEAKGKECSNLLILLSELYNFQVISCVLVYDIVRSLLDGDLSETDVELLLKLLRSASCDASCSYRLNMSGRLGTAVETG